jgi:mannose-1-phosphate guanylyltransferase / mannose-6-phosphate isomerase
LDTFLLMKPPIIPVIIAGGAGTRLWPVSRSGSPKQFLRLGQDTTLLHQTLERCKGEGFDDRPIIVSAEDNRGQLLSVVHSLGVKADLVLEPMQRNTCAAVAAGALRASERNPGAIVLVLAADHHIPDVQAFQQAVFASAAAAADGHLITFGVKPRFAATGYGYILPAASSQPNMPVNVTRFVEKPDAETAACYVTDGYLWNSGNFMFAASGLLQEMQRHAAPVVDAVSKALVNAVRDQDFIRLDKTDFEHAPKISFDHAVMEKTDRAQVLPVNYQWGDVGTWDAVANALPTDKNTNAIVGRAVVHDSANVMVHSEDMLTTVLGCEDLIVVATKDAVLVTRKGKSESVKNLVDMLRAQNIPEADAPVSEAKPDHT